LNGAYLVYGARQNDDAIEQSRIALKTVPRHPVALMTLLMAFYAKGMFEEAFNTAKSLVTAYGSLDIVEAKESGLAEAGLQEAMSRWAEEWAARSGTEYVQPSWIAGNYAMAGQNQGALDWLERGFEVGDPNMPYFGLNPFFDGLHDEPRFRDLLRRMNFPAEVLAKYLNETQ
jgi:hypothetical protein